MARAAMYYFESAAYCYICHKHTGQTRIFSSGVQDLDDPNVEISMHAACYRKEMARICLVAVFSFIMAATVLSFAGSYLLFRSFSPWSKLPAWLIVADIIAANIPAVYFGLRSYFKYWNRINHDIQLQTYPVY
jgi:hypothetical protein